jgi:two-component system, NarL family, nitrate/nitrite response regulator NarL
MACLSDLTPREMDILQLIVAGYSNKAIACKFNLAEKTVEFHLTHIYTKIGVRSRLMAGPWAVQHGMEIESREIPS